MTQATALAAANVVEAAPEAVVEARALSRRYGQQDTAVHALRGVSLSIEREKLTAVMGPSGSGKSTLMHLLAGLDRPTEGEVWIDGTNVTKLGDTDLTKLRRRHVGFVFQFFNLLPMLTAEENVLLPLSPTGFSSSPTARSSRTSGRRALRTSAQRWRRWGRSDRRRAEGTRGPQAPRRAYHARDCARRRDGERDIRLHRHHRESN